MTTGVITGAQIAERIRIEIDQTMATAIRDAEKAGDEDLAGRLRLQWLGVALDGFRYRK